MFTRTAEQFYFPAWRVPIEQQHSILAIATVLAIVAAMYAIWRSIRVRHSFPIFVFLGAGFSVLYEPLGDILTKVAYAPVDQISLATLFGRPIPLWMLPNYFFFFSFPSLLLEQFVARPGVTMRKWWMTYFGLALFVALFEQPGINADNWRYYGTQAFSINSYPIWVAFANSSSLMVIAAAVALLRRTIITPVRGFLFVPILPIVFIGAHVGGTLPVAAAIYSSVGQAVIEAAALLAIAICSMNVWLCFQLLQLLGSANPGARSAASERAG